MTARLQESKELFAYQISTRHDISIHGRDITTSGYWKQTSAIFKFYSRFRLWFLHRHRYVILHRSAEFCTK